MAVQFESKTPLVQSITASQCQLAIRFMLEDIARFSMPKTPRLEGNLRKSANRFMEGDYKGIIEWDLPYAQYQERGMRADGTHKVQNYTTPGTGKAYAEKAVEKVMNNMPEYITKAGIL